MEDKEVEVGAGDAPSIEGRKVAVEGDIAEDVEHPFLKALKNELVVKKLVSFLNFEDVKALSSVSKGCLNAVRETKEFSDRAKLAVCKEVINLGILKESTYLWKHISLDLSIPVEVVELIEDILEAVESLELRLPSVKEDTEVVHYLEKVFQKTRNLQCLELDVGIMNKVLHDVFSDVGVQSLMGKLHTLDIHGFGPKPDSVCYIDGSEDDGETPFQRNFLQISLMPLHLKKFSFGKVIPISGSESEHVKFIPKIVEAAKDTLEDLVLHLNVWSCEGMEAIRCPRLKRLKLSAYGGNKEATKLVETFIKNQPPLEELEIQMKKEFPITILQTLQGMLMKMRKLHLKAKRFVGSSEPVSWEFLETMTELRDFSIRKPFGWENNSSDIYGYGEDILKRLPACTEKISLQGFDWFWRDEPDDGNSEESKNIGALLARFENLKELNLLRSHGAVTDSGLQSIITNCPNLVSLTFSHCHDVNAFGLTGVDDTGGQRSAAGVSLKDLKGLTHLKIRSCPNINPDNVLSVVELPHLRTFDYYKNVALPEDFLLQIVRQNPCLESVALHIVTYDSDAEYISEIKKKVKEINPRVHLIETLEQSNWEDEDSDSDASSIHDNMGDGDSDFSGGGYPGVERYDDFDDYEDEFDDSPHDYDFDDEEDLDGDGDL